MPTQIVVDISDPTNQTAWGLLPLPGGAWVPGNYPAGTVANYSGSLFFANKQTSLSPSSADWTPLITSPWSNPVAWAPSTAYTATPPASVVTHGGSTYICTVSHTSGASFDASKFDAILSPPPGALIGNGPWNASTNTPALASGVGNDGYFYVVSVAGSTNLDGNTTWSVGDIAWFSAGDSKWHKINGGNSAKLSGGTFTGPVHFGAAVDWGNSGSRTETRDDAGASGVAGGFFETNAPTNYPSGATGWWHLLDVRHSNMAADYALQIAGSFSDQALYFRKTANNPAQPWTQIATLDGSGHIPTANLPAIPAANLPSIPAALLPAGSRVLVASYAASSSASIGAADAFSLSGYAHYEIEILNLVSSVDGNTVNMQLSGDASTFLTSALYETVGSTTNSGASVAESYVLRSSILVSRDGSYNSNGGGATRGISGRISLRHLAVGAGESIPLETYVTGSDTSTSRGIYVSSHAARYNNAAAMTVTGFKLFPSSGNFVSGVVNVYGYN